MKQRNQVIPKNSGSNSVRNGKPVVNLKSYSVCAKGSLTILLFIGEVNSQKKRKPGKNKKFTSVKIEKDISNPSLGLKITLANGVSITHIKDKQTLSMVFTLLEIRGC